VEGTDAQLSSEALESMAGVAVAQTENNARVTAATENMTGKINVEVDGYEGNQLETKDVSNIRLQFIPVVQLRNAGGL